MKLATTWLLAIACLSATPTLAQTTLRLGLRAGAALATTTLSPLTTTFSLPAYATSASKANLFGGQAGLALEMAWGPVALQPALLFTQKGDRSAASGYFGDFVWTAFSVSRTTRTTWLELPLNAVYTWHGVQVFGGPYLALALGGRRESTTTSYGYNTVNDPVTVSEPVTYGPQADSRRLDAGLNAGLGYRLGQWQLQLGYQLGLRNLHQLPPQSAAPFVYPTGNERAEATYTRGWQLTGTYFFARRAAN